jgi:hypothetical protein
LPSKPHVQSFWCESIAKVDHCPLDVTTNFGSTSTLKVALSFPPAFVAVTLNWNRPDDVGVPDRTPAALRDIPGGRFDPVFTVHVSAGDPVAEIVVVYASASKPSGSDVVVIIGFVYTFNVNDRSLKPAGFVARTVNVEAPAALGVPVIDPAELNVRPAGSVPTLTVKVGAVYPVAVTVWEYAVPVSA